VADTTSSSPAPEANTPAYPILLVGDAQTILFFRDPTQFSYVREFETTVPFKHGLPDIAFWEDRWRKVVAVESPFAGPDGQTYRIWINDRIDPQAPLRDSHFDGVFPTSIRPGAPSKMVNPDDDFTLKFGHMLLQPSREAEFIAWQAKRAVR
jgi:hypothetical protein